MGRTKSYYEQLGYIGHVPCLTRIIQRRSEMMLQHSPGMLVPRATKTTAVTESLIPKVQPKYEATSPITAVTTPIPRMLTMKHR